ncbi:MAG TPA: EamA family transporter [Caulobacteraceae bacterium]|nr:EamA family transporter [Caulobacteraceae bacterium]
MSQSLADAEAAAPFDGRDVAALVGCSLIWGSTWFAITFQLGAVPAAVSVAYRFALAAAMLFAWLAVTRRPVRLTRAQHLATFAQGALIFGINYPFVYLAEERLTSAVVAVLFAGSAFVNLLLFRIAFGARASKAAWAAAALGLAGVGLLSFDQLSRAHMDGRALAGFAFGVAAVIAAGVGNVAARKAQALHAELGANTAWAMAYGAGLLALFATLAGQRWSFDARPAYVLSLAYLALFGSVTAFLLYFGLARRRGYVLAAYISAVTPVIAMLISAVFEHAHWGLEALAGIACVTVGQVLLVRAPKGA